MEKRIRKYALLLVVSVIPLISRSQDYCDFIETIQDYQDSVRLKNNGEVDILDPSTFNFKTYLSFFNDIRFAEDVNPGVYYFDNILGGNPYLYATKPGHKLNYNSKTSLYRDLNKEEFRAKNHIIPDDTETGYLQYLFFYEMGEQFGLKWHSNYKKKYIICSSVRLDEEVKTLREANKVCDDTEEHETPLFIVDLNELDRFAQTDPAIEIKLTDDYCLITWIEYRTHSGFYRCIYGIERRSPYKIEMTGEELLVDIAIGFLY